MNSRKRSSGVSTGGDSARFSEGTGLGLAMVKDIAKYHGGTVEVASAVGEGSRFTVKFPA